jgi:hypothetical protein
MSHSEDTTFTPAMVIIPMITSHATVPTILNSIPPKMLEMLDDETRAALIAWQMEATPAGSYGHSAMNEKWHSHPQFFYGSATETQEQLEWLNRKTGSNVELPHKVDKPEEALQILAILEGLMELVGAKAITAYVKTSQKPGQRVVKPVKRGKIQPKPEAPRQTCRAVFELIGTSPTATRAMLPMWADKYQGDYMRALSFAAEFAGRVHLWFDAWVRSQAHILAKVGLLHTVVSEEDLSQLPLTCLFLALASAEFGKRKEFTLESQKQGGLNPHLRLLLDKVNEQEPFGLRFIAYMLPAKEIWDVTPNEDLEKIHALWESWMTLLSVTLETQWEKGVSKSARRQMRVLPGAHYQNGKSVPKSGVNSSLWNVVADAWQNGSRVLRGLDLLLRKPAKFWGKTLQLIANDQFAWGQASNKTMDPNVQIFDQLTRARVLPWRVAHPNFRDSFDSVHALTTLLKVCSEARVTKDGVTTSFNPSSWIGIPQIRKAEVTVHRDLICGCPVPPMPPLVFEWVSKVLKPFGATGWTGN